MLGTKKPDRRKDGPNAHAFIYKGGRLMGVVLSCDKYAEISKGK